MITTALLVRWENGWHEVNYAPGISRWGRKEATLGLGASKSITEVDTVSTRQLEIFSDPRTEVACDLFPRGESDTPIVAFSTADRLVVADLPGRPPANQTVQSITATQDDDGRVTYAVELADVLLTEQERFSEWVTKMANGTLGGDSRVAQPVSQVASGGADCCPPVVPAAGFVVSSTYGASSNGGYSERLDSAAYGTAYTLDTFGITVPHGTGLDGLNTHFELWQDVPGGDGSFEFATIDLGVAHDGGTFYATSYPNGKAMTIDLVNNYGIHFQGATQVAGFRLFATFTTPGTEVTLDWVEPCA